MLWTKSHILLNMTESRKKQMTELAVFSHTGTKKWCQAFLTDQTCCLLDIQKVWLILSLSTCRLTVWECLWHHKYRRELQLCPDFTSGCDLTAHHHSVLFSRGLVYRGIKLRAVH